MEGFNDLGVKMTTKDEDDTALYRNCNLSDTRLLSPILFPKISSKHVSLPDVGEDIQVTHAKFCGWAISIKQIRTMITINKEV